MATATEVTRTPDAQKTMQEVRELYADAPDIAKAGLENLIRNELKALSSSSSPRTQTAGRIGLRNGKVSELTMVVPFAKGGAKRLRGLLHLLGGNFQGADAVGTVHDMRFVFLDNDTKLLFATAYDGDFDPYIADFAVKIPNEMDVVFTAFEGWPGIHNPKVADWIADHQISAEGWYVANPNLTVAETRKVEKLGKAVEELLD